jgi:DNA-binding MarR family transcriptional regulator
MASMASVRVDYICSRYNMMAMGRSLARHRRVDDTSIADMLRILGRFRRRLRRIAPRSFDDGLTETQAEFLRLVSRHPGISVGEAAAKLGIADNTASTLVIQLVKLDLLVRQADPDDRRVGRLRLTRAAQKHSDLARERRHAMLAAALGFLDDTAYATLQRGLDVLSAVTDALGQEIER